MNESSRLHYYQALKLIDWQKRGSTALPPIPCFQERTSRLREPIPSPVDWVELQTKVAACTACSLHKTRTQTVFGIGNQQAELMVIGEAPGFYEDQQGEPFVGRAGLLLTTMLKSISVERHDIYIANVLKCRPPNNRDPDPHEVNLCTAYLNEQIFLIKPRLLIALGRIASHYLLKVTSSLESLRNKLHNYGDNRIPLIVTYHPAYLLRNPKDKKKAYLDLKFIKRTLASLQVA